MGKYFALWIAGICVLFFVMQMAIPIFTDALVLNQSSWTQPWRFVSAVFLHGSFSHLIFNMFALILFGLILEKIIGSRKFLVLYFASGVIANFIAVNFYSSSLGASGAIYGILGCLTILRPRMTVWIYSLPMPMFVAAVIWVGASIMGVFNPSNIGDIAHLSGIAVGFLFGFWLRLRYREKNTVRNFLGKVTIQEDKMRKWEDDWMR